MPRRKGASLTRIDVIEAALVCIQKDGEAGLGINRVARELGIQPPSLYNHVSSQEDLRQAVAMEGWRRLLALLVNQIGPLEEATRGLEQEQSWTTVHQMAHLYRRFAHDYPSLYGVMAGTIFSPNHPEFAALLQHSLQYYAECLRPIGLTGEHIPHAAKSLWAAVHGFVCLERSHWTTYPARDTMTEMDQSFEWLLATFHQALLTSLPPALSSERA
jgi:AcrR family transcriptional regulator